MQLSLGSGAVWGERTDVTGSGIGPRQFGVLQDIQIDFDWTDKELYGQLQFPVAIARGHGVPARGIGHVADVNGTFRIETAVGAVISTNVSDLDEIYSNAIPRLMEQSPAAIEVAVEHFSGSQG